MTQENLEELPIVYFVISKLDSLVNDVTKQSTETKTTASRSNRPTSRRRNELIISCETNHLSISILLYYVFAFYECVMQRLANS